MSGSSEIMAIAVVEAYDDKEEDCLQLLRDFYSVLRRKQYSRDRLYRDTKNPRRFINVRYWNSEAAREEAHEDPDVHAFWKHLSEIARVNVLSERLEDVSPRESMAQQKH